MYPNEPDPPLDTQFQETQMDFFHKLGYSTAQVQAIQQQYGPNVDTDKVLGELVRIRASRDASQGPLTTVSVLVPGGNAQTKRPTQLLPCTRSSPQSREEGGEDEGDLRPIVIDGSNVAMSHGNKEVFSCLGIQLAVEFFLDRGHTDITVFVPSWRKEQPRPDVPISDQHILRDLEKKKILVFTPSRRVAGKRVVCNDDWFIVKLAYESDGIMVSNDMYRDLQGKEPEWKRFIEQRLLMYSFVNNKFMPPDDPLGRHGPTLDNFLRRVPKTLKKQHCPYGKKCTFGVKCKFHHRQRSKQSNYAVADELRENTKHPCIDLKQSSFHSVSGQSLFLVEDMAKKLNLRHESGPLKKDHKHESLGQVKTGQSSNKKGSPRKETSGQYSSSDLALMQRNDSQEHLDSGLGSFDSLPMEAPWSDHQYGHAHSVRRHYGPPRSAPCSDCSSQHSAPAFQHHNQQFSHGPVSSHSSGMTPHSSAHYTSYGAYPVSMHDYNQHADYQHSRTHISQQYWSDPFGIPPPGVCRQTPEHSFREPPCETQQSPSWDKEREVVRKKLLGIFSASLVDRAMDMFPHLMDPQLLVAEILTLQRRNMSLR